MTEKLHRIIGYGTNFKLDCPKGCGVLVLAIFLTFAVSSSQALAVPTQQIVNSIDRTNISEISTTSPRSESAGQIVERQEGDAGILSGVSLPEVYPDKFLTNVAESELLGLIRVLFNGGIKQALMNLGQNVIKRGYSAFYGQNTNSSASSPKILKVKNENGSILFNDTFTV